jgi:hypothetical protein
MSTTIPALPNRIEHFAYEFDFLSNFFHCTIPFEGVAYASVEHAYQAAKFPASQREPFSLEFNPRLTAAQAKKLGRTMKGMRPDWDEIKWGIMKDLVLCKFTSYPELALKLVSTEGAYLEEGNWWHDTYWGVCKGKLEGHICKHGIHPPEGKNHLGHLLMATRLNIWPKWKTSFPSVSGDFTTPPVL